MVGLLVERRRKVAAPPPAAAPQVTAKATVHEMSAERKAEFAARMAKARAAKEAAKHEITSATPRDTGAQRADADDPLNTPQEMEAEVGAPGAAKPSFRESRNCGDTSWRPFQRRRCRSTKQCSRFFSAGTAMDAWRNSWLARPRWIVDRQMRSEKR